jgi:hypothetical protein
MRRGLGGVYGGWALALIFAALACAPNSARADASAAGGESQPAQSGQGSASQKTAPQPAPPQGASSQQTTQPSTAASQSSNSQSSPPPDALHFITVTFDYDFSLTRPCSTSTKHPVHPCASQFSVFEVTNGTSKKHRVFLFNVPLPAKPQGIVKGIRQQSPNQIDLVLGWHKLGVAAIDTDGWESTLNFCASCATWINVQAGPTPTPSVPAPGSSVTPPGVTPPSSTTPNSTPSH